MALPVPTKTWQHNVNNAQTAQGTIAADLKLLLFNLKTALIGFGTNPWTVVSSSNSVTASNADNWSSSANIVGAPAGSPHSWIVLKQTGIGSNAQLLIDCINANPNTITVKFSASVGFTGGTTSNAPTATDSFNVINAAFWQGVTVDAAIRWSVQQSTDGQCTRMFCFSAGVQTMFVAIDKGANPTGGTPGASNSGYCNWSAVTTGSGLGGNTVQNGTICAISVSYESASNLSIQSEVSGAWDVFPIAMVSATTVGTRGRLFTLQDIWLSSASIAFGDTAPATGSPAAQFIFLQGSAGLASSIMLPWNNGPVNLT